MHVGLVHLKHLRGSDCPRCRSATSTERSDQQRKVVRKRVHLEVDIRIRLGLLAHLTIDPWVSSRRRRRCCTCTRHRPSAGARGGSGRSGHGVACGHGGALQGPSASFRKHCPGPVAFHGFRVCDQDASAAKALCVDKQPLTQRRPGRGSCIRPGHSRPGYLRLL